MASQAPANNPPNAPDPFAPLQQLVSWIDSESHAQDVIDKARELSTEEQQLLVDVLSMALNKTKILSQCHAHAWSALIKIALSAHIFAWNWTVRSEYMATGSKASARVKVVRQTQDCMLAICHEKLIEWTHLSHPNILPLYASFLESEDHPSFVSPFKSTVKICDYAQSLAGDQRLPLILDVINGLCHLHRLNIVHGRLSPGTVLVSDEGRVLITDLDVPPEEEDSNVPLTCYSAPELSLEDDSQPTKVTDVWAFGCLGHEVLSGKVPFCQFSSNSKAISAIGRGDKPAQPGQDGHGGSAINDAIWNLLMSCWEYEAADRLTSSKIQEMLSHVHIEDHPSEPGSIIESKAIKSSIINLELTKAVLSQILSSHEPASLQVPKYLCDTLSWLVCDFKALRATERAAKKLNRDNTQTLVDLIELGIKYDPHKRLAEGGSGIVYQGANPTICIKLMKHFDTGTFTAWVKEVILWAHSLHPNVLPFLRVFLDSQSNPPQTCLVSLFMKNGNLRDYASWLAQKSWLPLIFDVVNGLRYLHDLGVVHGNLKGENVLISNEGHGLITDFGTSHVNMTTAATGSLSLTTLRFSAPETVLGNRTSTKKFNIWLLGCLLYEVLSRKPPYYQYKSEVQIIAALTRKEMLKCPGSIDDNDAEKDECGWDDDIEEDYNAIDNQAWNLIIKCCVPEPEAQPDIANVQELVVDMKIQEDHPVVKDAPGADILKSRVNPKINLTLVEELFN
ncbi:Mitogen-activated protein kinase kinase kinase 5 [Leucoagaricus sp. SymC.cos]|nr:Mitogen-activated protein kinase kinase kinase 5 [Leucoagaricus sp. SymC.cos]